jgi:hypothetical protein
LERVADGLFELVQRRADNERSWDIERQPEHLSASFQDAIFSHPSQPC